MIKFLPILLSVLMIWSCKSNVRSQNNTTLETEWPAKDKKSTPFVAYNADSTLFIEKSISKLSAENPFPSVKFIVIDLIKNDTVYIGLEKNADVEWYNINHIKVTRKPEMITLDQKPEDYIFILNPMNRKVYRLREYEANLEK
jgi:hypothetical protein